MAPLRAGFLLTGFFVLALLAIPVQGALLLVSKSIARAFPKWFFGLLCRVLGIRIHTKGAIVHGQSVLLAANHTSYFDILVLGAVGHVSFISKSEVKDWPLFGVLAKLSRTVFVERERRAKTGVHRDMIHDRLAAGDTLILFPEGTSSDGNRVLPFKSALIGAASPSRKPAEGDDGPEIVVQPVSVAYTRLHGLPMGRQYRPQVAWYGDMDLVPHLWEALGLGPIDVEVHFYPPVMAKDFRSRRAMTDYCHGIVAEGVGHALAGRDGLPGDEERQMA